MTLIDGLLIREHVKQQCQTYKQGFETTGIQVVIVQFETPKNISTSSKARYEAARISARQKSAIFRDIGVVSNRIVLPHTISTDEFQKSIQVINQDDKVIAAIIQYPVPPQLDSLVGLLSPQKDIDIVRRRSNNLFSGCATAEGIARVLEPYLEPNSRVAIVGGGGFVGRGVINYLQQSSTNYFILEQGDEISRITDADIIVTATGQPGFLTPYILPSHRLVVDAGFTPTRDGPLGDIDTSAYSVPQRITPVPGGVGPIEMAILAERLVLMALGVDLPKWNYQQLEQQQQQYADAIASAICSFFQYLQASAADRVSNPQPGLAVFEDNHYRLTLNMNENTLSLARISERLTLVKLDLTNNQIKTARGLTEDDAARWQRM